MNLDALAQAASAVGLGIGLGVFTGLPLGVINVAVVDAAGAGDKRFAIRLGIGGAIADGIQATLAFAGVGRIITLHPEWTRVMAATVAVVIVGYAVITWRRRRKTGEPRRHRHGVVTGVFLTLPNPGALAAWVAVAAFVWPTISVGDALVLGVGVLLGSASWFALLATWVSKVRPDHAILRIIPRIALVVLLATAAYGLGRIFYGS